MFLIFSAHGQNCLRWPKWGQEDLFPTNPELADILGRMDLDSEKFYVLDCLDPNILDFQVPRSLNSQIFRSPDFQISRRRRRRTNFRSQPDPSPNAPRDQICRKEPLLRHNRQTGSISFFCSIICIAEVVCPCIHSAMALPFPV